MALLRGWEGLTEEFADRVLSYNGYDMEKLVVAIAKDAGLWSRDVERDSEAEALHLIFRGREAPIAIAKAAWRIFQDAERLETALRAAGLMRK